MDEIHANASFNCRGDIAPMDVLDLVKGIEAVGLIQPVAVRLYTHPDDIRKNAGKRYSLVCGFRRYKAHQILKKEEIPAVIVQVNDVEARVLNLKENLERQNLNVVQEARSIEQFKYMGFSMDWIADQVGKSYGWVQVRFNLLDLSPEIQEAAAAGVLNQVQIREIYSIRDPNKRNEVVKAIKEKRERGEKTSLVAKMMGKKSTKRTRTRPELFIVQAEIRNMVGPNILTRLIGWACGEVDDKEFYAELKEHLDSTYGCEFKIPERIYDESA